MQTIRLIDAPVFIATKLEAFRDRGQSDFLASHDLEDIITIIDGRASLVDEVRNASDDLRSYVVQEFRSFTASSSSLDAAQGHLPRDAASQSRYPELIRRCSELAE